MSDTSLDAGGAAGARRARRTYVGVIAVEALVLAAIWVVQRYFGS